MKIKTFKKPPERIWKITQKILAGKMPDQSERDAFDDWKFEHSTDDVVNLFVNAARAKNLSELPNKLTRQQFEKLWCACSDLRSVIDQQPVGSVRYLGNTFQNSVSYDTAIRVLQETEKVLFGEIKTHHLSDFLDLSKCGI